jgi:hypothetical protein
MSKPNISAVLTDADKETIKTNIKNSKLLMPFLLNLSVEERAKLRKIGSKREGYVEDVYDTSIANAEALPAELKTDEWTKDELLTKQLVEVREVLSSFMEAVEDTILLLGNERIHFADLAYGHLKQSAKNNSSISNDIERIARQFEGMGRRKNVSSFTIAPQTIIEVKNVVTKTKVANTGDTVLRFKAGADLANIVKMATITINPGSSALIPAKCSIISIENTSVDVIGSFSVKTK